MCDPYGCRTHVAKAVQRPPTGHTNDPGIPPPDPVRVPSGDPVGECCEDPVERIKSGALVTELGENTAASDTEQRVHARRGVLARDDVGDTQGFGRKMRLDTCLERP